MISDDEVSEVYDININNIDDHIEVQYGGAEVINYEEAGENAVLEDSDDFSSDEEGINEAIIKIELEDVNPPEARIFEFETPLQMVPGPSSRRTSDWFKDQKESYDERVAIALEGIANENELNINDTPEALNIPEPVVITHIPEPLMITHIPEPVVIMHMPEPFIKSGGSMHICRDIDERITDVATKDAITSVNISDVISSFSSVNIADVATCSTIYVNGQIISNSHSSVNVASCSSANKENISNANTTLPPRTVYMPSRLPFRAVNTLPPRDNQVHTTFHNNIVKSFKKPTVPISPNLHTKKRQEMKDAATKAAADKIAADIAAGIIVVVVKPPAKVTKQIWK